MIENHSGLDASDVLLAARFLCGITVSPDYWYLRAPFEKLFDFQQAWKTFAARGSHNEEDVEYWVSVVLEGRDETMLRLKEVLPFLFKPVVARSNGPVGSGKLLRRTQLAGYIKQFEKARSELERAIESHSEATGLVNIRAVLGIASQMLERALLPESRWRWARTARHRDSNPQSKGEV